MMGLRERGAAGPTIRWVDWLVMERHEEGPSID